MEIAGEGSLRPIVRVPPLGMGAGRMSRVTFGGMERGARPMLEWGVGVVLKGRLLLDWCGSDGWGDEDGCARSERRCRAHGDRCIVVG